MKNYPALTFLLLLCTVLPVAAQSPVALFDNSGLSNWQYRNTLSENFSLADGVLLVSGDRGWLQSPTEYQDFILETDIRFLEPDSDSGIFLRVESGTDFILGWPGDAYQVQIREISVNDSDNPLPLANLYRHRVDDGTTRYQREKVFDIYSGVDQWQSIRIIVIGSKLLVELNGEVVTTADNLINLRGYIGFQSEKGRVEYRNTKINEL